MTVVIKTPDVFKIVVGIDPSTSTGIAVIRVSPEGAETVYSTVLKFPKEAGFNRHFTYYKMMSKVLSEFKPDFVAVEGYSHGSRFSNTLQVELGSIVRLGIAEHGVPGIQIAPTSLKKFVTSKGNCKKDLIMKEVYKRWNFEGTDDECDAYSLARFGGELLFPGSSGLPKVNLESVKAWHVGNNKLGAGKFLIPE